MAFSLSGYLLEPPRVGSSNNPFTASPNNLVYDQAAWNLAYPSSETAPNDHYCILALTEGKLPAASFGWTKNETLTRFDYNGRCQRFQTLPGDVPDVLGAINSSINTSRLKAPKLISSDIVNFPIRLSASDPSSSGTTFQVTVVPDEAHFSPDPGAGHVELAQEEGTLNWSSSDLVTFVGRNAVFQRQTFQAIAQGAGKLGLGSDILLLAPLPATGQYPLLRLGYGAWLVSIEKAQESAFSADPAPGTVEWAVTTGRLKFNTGDIASGKTVYYDGVLMAAGLQVRSADLGLVNAPSPLVPTPLQGGDVIFQAVSSGLPVYQWPTTIFGTADVSTLVPGQVQINPTTGAISICSDDVATYGLCALVAYVCDLPLEHGIELRLYRSPADPGAANLNIKDVTVFYRATEATLVAPIIGSPIVYLPALPFESADPAYRLIVKVEQGMGSYVSEDFPNLLLVSPTTPLTYGYTLDYDAGQLTYALRRVDCVIDRPLISASTALIDGLVSTTNLKVELERSVGSGDYRTLDLTQEAYVEDQSGVVYFTKTYGTPVAQGTKGAIEYNLFLHETVFSDDDSGLGAVHIGDLLYISSETTTDTVKGIYTVTRVISATSVAVDSPVAHSDLGPLTFEVRRGCEVLADRYFMPVVLSDPFTKVERFPLLGEITNSPRLSIPTKWISPTVRFRYGTDRYSVVVSIVAIFSDPTAWPAGTVEILSSTGELNFAQVDVTAGGIVYCGHTLEMGVDYQITAELGLISFTDRMLEREEGLITYVPSSTGILTTEKMRFLVRKELAQPHPTPTSVLQFNPYQHLVADAPIASVYRGGRPQDVIQVNISTQQSAITFLPDQHLDGLLPHGAVVNPIENVYIDYYIYDAVGGEQTTYVLFPPMTLAQVIITEGDTDFGIQGDWTTKFQSGDLLRISTSEVHVIGNVALTHSYHGVAYPAGVTVISLKTHDYFRESWQKPQLFVSSGLVSSLFWSYFVLNLASYNMVARGSQQIVFEGDRTDTLHVGTVLCWSYGSVLDYNQITGVGYDSETGTTQVTLASPAARQYYGAPLRRSLRPVYEDAQREAQTNLVPVQPSLPAVPITMKNLLVYSRKDGARGIVLTNPQDFTIDDSGHIVFQQALEPLQEWVILYTGHLNVAAGRRLRVSYTASIVPTEENGIHRQELRADYTTFSPDSFYYRVVKMTDFRNELVAQYWQEAVSVSTSGPMLSNTGGTQLYESGQPSLYFPEGHAANVDMVSRSILKFYNDCVNALEDVLQNIDGRIVGSEDGRFVFDGVITNWVPPDPADPFIWANVTNQIDDKIKILDAPYICTWVPPLSWVQEPRGTYVLAYQGSPWSRFYPTWKRTYGVTTTGVNTGDSVMDTGSWNLTDVTNLRTRLAWAVTTVAALDTDTVIYVDNATGASENVRPPFLPGQKVVVQQRDGTILTTTPFPLEIASGGVATTCLTFTEPIGVAVPSGSTVYRYSKGPDVFTTDPNEVTNYQLGRDYNFDPNTGQILYVKPFWPFDGTVPLVPAWALCIALPSAMALSCEVTLNNAATAPAKVPALYGGTTDDDGEVLFPVQSPSFDCESTLTTGHLQDEYTIIQPGTGTMRLVTVDPFISQGNLDALRTTITVTGLPMTTLPEQYDLVRIVTGLNANSEFHRVLSSTPTTITVDYPFTVQDTGFSFVLTVSPDVFAGIGATVHEDTLTDAAAHFLTSNVKVGHTIVVKTGVYAGQRHQVSKIVSDTELEFEHPVPALPVVCAYRVSNSLSTYGSLAGAGTLQDAWVNALIGELGVLLNNAAPGHLNCENAALAQFFDLVFTYIVTGAAQVTALTLTDAAANFITAGVKPNDIVYITGAVDYGFYTVVSVTDATHLTVSSAFPVTTTTAYQIGQPFGVSPATLTALMHDKKHVITFAQETQETFDLATTEVPILLPPFGAHAPGVFARGYTAIELLDRATRVQARVSTVVPEFKSTVENSLNSGDSLYDRRYTWINARINLNTGTLVKWIRAIQSRQQAQIAVVEAMTKLLAISPSGN